MNIADNIVSEIYRLSSLNNHPKYIYLGEEEYQDLKLFAGMISMAECGLRDEFMGIEIIRVSMPSHFNVTL